MKSKPHLSCQAFKLLSELNDYITRFDLRGDDLAHAAPDVFDGAVRFSDIEELHRRKWLRFESYWSGRQTISDHYERLCGESWTVVLTRNAIRRFWPERMLPNCKI